MAESNHIPQARSGSRKERLIVLSIFGFLALNYPLLALFDNKTTWFDIPVLFLYLLIIWAAVIVSTAWILESRKQRRRQKMKGPQE